MTVIDTPPFPGVFRNVFNVLDYGADPTGVSGTSAAIQAAINAALASQPGPTPGGAIVYIPPGLYKINSTLLVGGGQMDGITIQGAGMGATLLRLASGANVDIIQFTQDGALYSFFHGLRDITMDGNYANNLTAGNCINAPNAIGPSDLIFERVFARSARVDGFHLVGAVYSPSLFNCISEFNRGWGVFSTPNIIRIIGGKFQSDITGCINMTGGGNPAIRKTAIIDGAYILCDAASAAKGLWLNCAQATVTGCHIVNGASNTGDLILLDSAGDYTLSGNMLVGAQATGYAIKIAAGVTNVNIHDNDIIGTFAAGKINLASVPSGSIAIRHNWGFNPVGILATPFDNVNNLIGFAGTSGTLTSAKVYTCTGCPVDIAWTGGTVSAQAKNGTAIPQVVGAADFVHLEPGDTYSITFTVTPTTFDVFGL